MYQRSPLGRPEDRGNFSGSVGKGLNYAFFLGLDVIFACYMTQMLAEAIGIRFPAVGNVWRAWESLDERGKVRTRVGNVGDVCRYLGTLDV